jgi:hypothetical protein
MSFISSQVTPGAIIMIADRCVCAFATTSDNNRPSTVAISNSAEKIHVTRNGIGISSCGAGYIGKEPMERYIYEFIYGLDTEKHKTPFDVVQHFKDFFRNLDPNLEADFHIGGYDLTDKEYPKPALYQVDIKRNTIDKANQDNLYQGAMFNSPTEFTHELFKRLKYKYTSSNIRQAIDFAIFVKETTRLMMRFSGEGESISKEHDLLIIRPNGYEWMEGK